MSSKLLVGGIVPLTTVDYPGHLASVIFMQGCPWRCKYCHNPHLQSISPAESLPWEDILRVLSARRGLVEGVVFSGGEPLLQDALGQAILDVKQMGFKIGMHTAGAFPERLAKVISYLDWVGFDVKHNFKDYDSIVSIAGQGKAARNSLEILIASNVDFEVRITLHDSIPVYSVVEVLKELSAMGVKNIVLQKCRDKDENVIEHPIFSDKILLEDMSGYFDSLSIRG